MVGRYIFAILQQSFLMVAMVLWALSFAGCSSKGANVFEPNDNFGWPDPLIMPTDYSPPADSGLIDPEGFGSVLYAPYILEVVIPDKIVEASPFEIVIFLSAEFRPAILYGYPNDLWLAGETLDRSKRYFFYRHHGDKQLFTIGSTIVNPPGEGEPISNLILHFDGLAAGDYVFAYSTAAEPRLGGIGAVQNGRNSTPWSDLADGDPEFLIPGNIVSKEVKFTVLPQEDAGS
ncbi:MAG: hypothetical protein HRF49_10980 [bacterium]|jgi:hypothetical protein